MQYVYGKSGPNHMSDNVDLYRELGQYRCNPELGWYNSANNDDVISCFFSNLFKHGGRV